MATWPSCRLLRRSGGASCRRTRKSTLSFPWARRRSTAKGFEAGIGPRDRAPAA
jgi:hypothetical protein